MTPHVLIVDHDPQQRLTLARALDRAGYEVTVAGAGETVFALIAASQYDLVLIDVHLPLVPGDVLSLAILRTWPELRGRLVLLSRDARTLAQAPDDLRACPVLTKPIRLAALYDVVGRLLAAAEPRRHQSRSA